MWKYLISEGGRILEHWVLNVADGSTTGPLRMTHCGWPVDGPENSYASFGRWDFPPGPIRRCRVCDAKVQSVRARFQLPWNRGRHL